MTAPPREQYCTHARICDRRGNRCVIGCGLPERWMVAAPAPPVAQPAEPPFVECVACVNFIKCASDQVCSVRLNAPAEPPAYDDSVPPIWKQLTAIAKEGAEPPATDDLVQGLICRLTIWAKSGFTKDLRLGEQTLGEDAGAAVELLVQQAREIANLRHTIDTMYECIEESERREP